MSAAIQKAALDVAESGVAACRICTGLAARLKDQLADADGRPETTEAYRIAEMVDWVAERLEAELVAFREKAETAGWL